MREPADDNHDADGIFRDGVPFLGGSLWIDLLNTTPALDGHIHDLIADKALLTRWMELAGIDAKRGLSDCEHESVLELRTLLRQAFDLMAAGKTIPGHVADAINAIFAKATITRKLDVEADPPRLVELQQPSVAEAATSIATDFARFATEYKPGRMRHCANPDCTMVFYDHGKNNRRRWCTMTICGNRDKVANFRARKSKPAKP